MKELYVIGAGSVGAHLAFNLNNYLPDHRIAGFFDDSEHKRNLKINGIPVLGEIDEINNLEKVKVVIGIAFPALKEKIYHRIKNQGFEFPTLISKNAWISENVILGHGCIIYPNTSINFSCRLGDFVILNMNCALGHETSIGSFSSLAPGVNLGGHTNIEEGCDIGIGVSTKQDISVGKNSIIGGQSMVVSNVPPGSLAYGVPAKIKS